LFFNIDYNNGGKSMIVKVDEVIYLPGDYALAEKSFRSKKMKGRGEKPYKAGEIIMIASHYGKKIQVRIDLFFRDHFKKAGSVRLTKSRVGVIIATRPEYVTIEYFQNYYRLSKEDAEAWCLRAFSQS
jgi:hypothetical protein